MKTSPIILVPGWWLGAWAWDDVAAALRADGHDVTALTLPGLESVDDDRSSLTLADHVDAIVSAVRAAGEPVVLAVHSGAGFPGYAATDVVPELIAHAVYVDTGPGKGKSDGEFADVDRPLDWENLEKNENLEGVSDAQKATFRERAVPQPGGVLRTEHVFTNDARLDVPSTLIATAFPSTEYKDYIKEGYEFLAGFGELRNLDYVDLPTSHWPMFSRPKELAQIIGRIAKGEPAG